MAQQNMELFLNKKWVEDFFNKNNQMIFQQTSKVKLIDLRRSNTFDKKSYNLLYVIEIGNQRKEIRLYYSHKHDVEKAYNALKYFYQNGFDRGQSRTPKPYIYLKNYNIIIYENIQGQTFMHELDRNKNELKNRMSLIAKTLKKIHSLPLPSFEVIISDWKPGEKVAAKNIPDLVDQIEHIKNTIFRKLDKNKASNLCHGDFQPNNLIINNDIVYIIDFGSICITDKELDIASFVIQLQIMLKKFGDINSFNELKDIFLAIYDDYNQEKYNLYLALISIVLLEFMISFPDFENNKSYIPFIYSEVKKNLEKVGINFRNDRT